jgi:hypothetical protein
MPLDQDRFTWNRQNPSNENFVPKSAKGAKPSISMLSMSTSKCWTPGDWPIVGFVHLVIAICVVFRLFCIGSEPIRLNESPLPRVCRISLFGRARSQEM